MSTNTHANNHQLKKARTCALTGHKLGKGREVMKITGLNGCEITAKTAVVVDQFLCKVDSRISLDQMPKRLRLGSGVNLRKETSGSIVLDAGTLIKSAPAHVFDEFRLMLARGVNPNLARIAESARDAR